MNYKEELHHCVRTATINTLPDYIYDKCLHFARQGKTSCELSLNTKELIDHLGEIFNIEYFKIRDYKIEEIRSFRNLKYSIVVALNNCLGYEIYDLNHNDRDQDNEFSLSLKVYWS